MQKVEKKVVRSSKPYIKQNKTKTNLPLDGRLSADSSRFTLSQQQVRNR